MGQGEKPALVISQGTYMGQRWVLDMETLVIGREVGCDVVLPERQISRQHVKIKRADDSYVVEDLESTNGTWVNGEPLKGERPLHDGDVIDLAQAVKLHFVESEATAPINPGVLTGGKLRLDRESRRVFVGSKEITPPLSLPQYRLLELLFDAKGAVCTRDQVIKSVWPDVQSEGVSEQAIDALVRRLRDRIAEIDPDGQYIVTVRGHGFRVEMG